MVLSELGRLFWCAYLMKGLYAGQKKATETTYITRRETYMWSTTSVKEKVGLPGGGGEEGLKAEKYVLLVRSGVLM